LETILQCAIINYQIGKRWSRKNTKRYGKMAEQVWHEILNEARKVFLCFVSVDSSDGAAQNYGEKQPQKLDDHNTNADGHNYVGIILLPVQQLHCAALKS
jgi:hypothetical protein